MPPLVERLGRELDDGKVLVLCRYIETEPRVWDWLGQAGQTRILAKIDNAPISELVSVTTPRHRIQLGPATKARHVAIVGERLLKRFKQEDENVLESVISLAPCLAFVGEALTPYSASSSFAMAENLGEKLLLPHAKYFAAEDIQKLNIIIRENAYDRILRASQTATILTQVFDETRHLLPASALHWSAIAEYVVTKNAAGDYGYPEFLAELKDAGVICN